MDEDEPLDSRLTERQNPRSMRIDQLSTIDIVDLINAEDAGVAAAVAQERQPIARAIDLVVAAFERGGRLIYVGAGTSGRLGVLDASEMPPTYGADPELVQGIMAGGFGALLRGQEGAEDDRSGAVKAIDEKAVCEKDFVLGIAASGTTPFVHAALQRARAGCEDGLPALHLSHAGT